MERGKVWCQDRGRRASKVSGRRAPRSPSNDRTVLTPTTGERPRPGQHDESRLRLLSHRDAVHREDQGRLRTRRLSSAVSKAAQGQAYQRQRVDAPRVAAGQARPHSLGGQEARPRRHLHRVAARQHLSSNVDGRTRLPFPTGARRPLPRHLPGLLLPSRRPYQRPERQHARPPAYLQPHLGGLMQRNRHRRRSLRRPMWVLCLGLASGRASAPRQEARRLPRLPLQARRRQERLLGLDRPPRVRTVFRC